MSHRENDPAPPPRHIQVRQTLEARLIAGVYAVGSLLPTELELAREFDASRFTIREALRHLRAQGFVERRQGVGTRVVGNRAQARYSVTVASLEDLFQIVTDARFEISAEETVELDADLARMVGGRVGEAWLRVEGVRHLTPDSGPMVAIDAYLPKAVASLLPTLRRSRAPWFSELEAQGLGPILSTVQEISACAMPAGVAQRLSVPTEGCALRLLRRYVTPRGVILAAVNWHTPEDMIFVIEAHRTDPKG